MVASYKDKPMSQRHLVCACPRVWWFDEFCQVLVSFVVSSPLPATSVAAVGAGESQNSWNTFTADLHSPAWAMEELIAYLYDGGDLCVAQG